jgi:DNA-binding LytR/AlgR family response regulator
MNCIIVSDNKTSPWLEEYISRFSSLKLAGSFTDPKSLISYLSENENIELIFLDIDKCGINTFDLPNNLHYQPHIILISSCDQTSFKTFNFGVIDHMMKPVAFSRFSKAVEKAIRYYSDSRLTMNSNDEVFIKKDLSLIKVKLGEIIYIEAKAEHISLHTANENFEIHFTIKGFENQLPPELFIRVHRSYIVNRNLIRKVSGNYIELIRGNQSTAIPLEEPYKNRLVNDSTIRV